MIYQKIVYIDGNIGLEENKSIKSEENKVDVFKNLEKSDTNNRNESKVEPEKVILEESEIEV